MSGGFSLEVVYVDGRKEGFDFGPERVTLGSAEDATVRIAGIKEIAPYHVLLVASEGGVWVSTARDIEVPVTCNGLKVENSVVPWNTELDIGPITLKVLETAAVREGRARKKQMLLRIGALAGAGMFVLAVLQQAQVSAPKQPVEPPALFDEEPSGCDLRGQEAFRRAAQLFEAGGAYMQRYAFDAQDGIRAFISYDKAKACFDSAGDAARARVSEQFREDVRGRLDDDYRTARVRLTRSLKVKDYRAAKRQVAALSNLLQHRPGKYVDWLREVWKFINKQLG